MPREIVLARPRHRAPERVRYLAEISESLREFHRFVHAQARIARERQSLRTSKACSRHPASGWRASTS